MKKRSLFLGGLLLLVMAFSITGCKIGGDDKKDEVVENPLDKIQYYIVGTVSDGNGTLDGVEVSVGDNKTTTANGGQYSLTVTSSSTQEVSFAKEGMTTYTTQAIFTSTENHSQVILNVTLAKAPDLSKGKEVIATPEGLTIEAPNIEDESADPAIIEIPAGGIEEGTKVTAVVYEAATDVNAKVVSFNNIYIKTEPAEATVTAEYKITIANPGNSNEYFDETNMELIKEDAPITRANSSSIKFSSSENKYLVTLPANIMLAGHYSLYFKFDKSEIRKTGDYNPVVFNGTTYNNTLQIENAEYSAMQNLKLTIQAKYGWEYSVDPQTALANIGASALLAETINKYISKIEGGQTYMKNEEFTTSVSGHKTLYFSSKQKVTEKTYTFKIKIGLISKSVVVKLNCYNGHTIDYEEKNIGDHSGGTTGSQN